MNCPGMPCSNTEPQASQNAPGPISRLFFHLPTLRRRDGVPSVLERHRHCGTRMGPPRNRLGFGQGQSLNICGNAP